MSATAAAAGALAYGLVACGGASCGLGGRDPSECDVKRTACGRGLPSPTRLTALRARAPFAFVPAATGRSSRLFENGYPLASTPHLVVAPTVGRYDDGGMPAYACYYMCARW